MLFDFMSHVAFNQVFIESHATLFKETSKDLTVMVHEYIKDVMITIVSKQLKDKYPPLMDATKRVVVEFLDKQKGALENVIEQLINSEAFIFTQQDDYASRVKLEAPSTENEVDVGITFMQKALKVYSDIAISRFGDYVPMQCHLFLITSVYKHLHEYVDFEKMSAFLVDESSIVGKRNEINKSLDRFTNALDILKSL